MPSDGSKDLLGTFLSGQMCPVANVVTDWEPGEVSHVPVLGGIMDNGFKEPSPVSGDASDLPVSSRIVSGPGPPELELGDTLGLPDFSADIDPGPGESFQRGMRSGSISWLGQSF